MEFKLNFKMQIFYLKGCSTSTYRKTNGSFACGIYLIGNMTFPGVNFINVLRAAFAKADLKSAKKAGKLSVFSALLESACVKSFVQNVGEIDPQMLNEDAEESGRGCRKSEV